MFQSQAINGSTVVKCTRLEQVYLSYQISALTVCELPCLYMEMCLWNTTVKIVQLGIYTIIKIKKSDLTL